MVDTCHFRGNYAESVQIEAAEAIGASTASLLAPSADVDWQVLLPRARLTADNEHTFKLDRGELKKLSLGKVSHLRVTIFPDGGIMRVKAFGRAVAAQPPEEPITDTALLANDEAGSGVGDQGHHA